MDAQTALVIVVVVFIVVVAIWLYRRRGGASLSGLGMNVELHTQRTNEMIATQKGAIRQSKQEGGGNVMRTEDEGIIEGGEQKNP